MKYFLSFLMAVFFCASVYAADLSMDVDTALSEVPVNLYPLIDDTDQKTIEESVAYNESGMDLIWHFETTGGVKTSVVVTPTTSGDYDWAHDDGGIYTIEIPASGGASANNDTEGFGWFTGVCDGVLPWKGPVIQFRATGLNNALIDSPYSTTRGLAGTALPDAAADAAGGLPISYSGSLNLDSQIGSDINAILADTFELTTDDIPGALATIEGKIDTIDDFLDTEIGDMLTILGALNDLSAAEVNAQVLDVLNTDTFSEPGQGAPPALPTFQEMIHYLYKAWRNKTETTSDNISVYDDAGTTVDHKNTISDDGTTFTKGEYETGP